MNYNHYYKVISHLTTGFQNIQPTRNRGSKGTHHTTGVSLNFINIWGPQEYLLSKRFISLKAAASDLCWMLRGSKEQDLDKLKIKWWDQWRPNLGPIYGHQWRDFNGFNQLEHFLEKITLDRYSRRHIVSMWNPNKLDDMCLPPCPFAFQLVISKTSGSRDVGSLIVYQRSADMFVGLPYDVLTYLLLLLVLGRYFFFKPHRLVFHIGDAHIYMEHVEAVKKMLTNPSHFKQTLSFTPRRLPGSTYEKMLQLEPEDFFLKNYPKEVIPDIKGTLFK